MEAAKEGQKMMQAPAKALENTLTHAGQVANTSTPQQKAPDPASQLTTSSAPKKQGIMQGVGNIANRFADSNPNSSTGKMLSGAMQFGRGALKQSGIIKPKAQSTQSAPIPPKNAEKVDEGMDEGLGIDVVKSYKKYRTTLK